MINAQDINNIYNQSLGRDATSAEQQSFLQYANNGSVPLTQFDLQQIVQGTPEYQQQKLQDYGSKYQDTLGASDQRLLGLSQNAVTQQFASQGRNIGSSGYLNAYANAAANLAMSRQQQLANFYGGGYQNILSSGVSQANGSQGNAISQQNSTLGFQRQMALYQQQQTDYQNWVNSQNRKGFGAGIGSIIGDVAQGVGAAKNAYSMAGGGGGGGPSGNSSGGGLFGSTPNYGGSSGYTSGFGGYGGFQGYNGGMRTGGQ